MKLKKKAWNSEVLASKNLFILRSEEDAVALLDGVEEELPALQV